LALGDDGGEGADKEVFMSDGLREEVEGVLKYAKKLGRRVQKIESGGVGRGQGDMQKLSKQLGLDEMGQYLATLDSRVSTIHSMVLKIKEERELQEQSEIEELKRKLGHHTMWYRLGKLDGHVQLIEREGVPTDIEPLRDKLGLKEMEKSLQAVLARMAALEQGEASTEDDAQEPV